MKTIVVFVVTDDTSHDSDVTRCATKMVFQYMAEKYPLSRRVRGTRAGVVAPADVWRIYVSMPGVVSRTAALPASQ